MRGSYHPVTLRVQALTLAYCGVYIKNIEATTGMPRQAIQYWIKKARERGYNPEIDPRILPVYVEDGKRTGRPGRLLKQLNKLFLILLARIEMGVRNLLKFWHLKLVSLILLFYTFLSAMATKQSNKLQNQVLLMR
jgi:hypothetical protein